MSSKQDLRFERFKLDRRNQELRRDERPIPLRPKTFAVLQYLAENPARLIPHEELLKGVWGPVAVGDGLLGGYIRELRQSLGDDAENPRFIETVPRRGFRFLQKVTLDPAAAVALKPIPSTHSAPAPELVGRDQELSALIAFARCARPRECRGSAIHDRGCALLSRDADAISARQRRDD